MPLDGHGYLVNQGWSGKGKGLREGAVSRPLAIPQKKTLSGLGRDRDEAFPFWDHLFSAAAKSIQVKCLSDDEDSETSNAPSTLKRTSTGILSNRRPLDGTPATSGSSTPFAESEASKPALGLIATAKRDAAKRGLYARFFRGPVISPDSLADEEKRLAAIVTEVLSTAPVQSVTITEHIDVETSEGHTIVDVEASGSTKKKRRKAKDIEEGEEDKEARRERKRRKREKKEKERRKEEKTTRKEAKSAKKMAKLKAEEPRCDHGDLKKHKSESSRKEKQVSEVNGIQLVDNPKKKKRKRDSSSSEIT